MGKKGIALFAIAVSLFTAILSPAAAGKASAANNSADQLLKTLGIMKTDVGYLEDDSDNVTRSQFAQLLVNASIYKGKIPKESNLSLYSDVPSSHWAAGYIQTAITKGWMSGYLNGTFKPDKGITLQEAVKGVITLLGYTSSDFTGNIMGGQMALYESKELNKNIRKSGTQYLTVRDCKNLFYNLLHATTKDGMIYAQTLGYTVDSNGNLDYLSVVNHGVEGPIIADDDWKSEIPFSVSKAICYLDGAKAGLSDIGDYDVIYYSKELETIWVYDNKVTGVLEGIHPDQLNPQSVTVAGKEYTFETSEASIAFSTLGNVKEGDLITLLLGKNDTVVSAINTYEYDTAITGIALETGTHLAKQADGAYVSTEYVRFVDAAGNEYKQDYDNTLLTIYKDDLVRVTYEDGKASVSVLKDPGTEFDSYTFRADGSYLGSTPFASNVKILDISGGKYVSVYPSRLGSVIINRGMILYCEKNERGAVSQLILDDVTGDMYDYGILTEFTYPMSLKSNLYTYNYILDGKLGSVTGDIVPDYNTEIGPKGFLIAENELVGIKNLTKIAVTKIGSTFVQNAEAKYPLAGNCAVYFYLNGEYTATTIDKLSNLSRYMVSAYYDKEAAYGGSVRVIVAENID